MTDEDSGRDGGECGAWCAHFVNGVAAPSRVQVNLNTADLGGDMYFDLGWGQLSPGRVCHQVLIFI